MHTKGVSSLSEAKPGIASLRVTIAPLLGDLFSLTAFRSCSCFHSRSVYLSVCLFPCCPVFCLLYSLAEGARLFEDLTVGECYSSMRV